MSRLLRLIKYFLFGIFIILVFIVMVGFIPKGRVDKDYLLVVHKGEGISSVLSKMSRDNIIYNYYVGLIFAYILDVNKKLKEGFIHLDLSDNSIYRILLKVRLGPNKIFVRIIEGRTFLDVKNYLDSLPNIVHNSSNLSIKQLEMAIDSKFSYSSMEGFLYPATYDFYEGVSDITIYKRAYNLMCLVLDRYWDNRDSNLPYKSKYELLTMASLIEKETGNKDDMRNISAVFVNRIRRGMLLQSDPTVIYGLGVKYMGRIMKADLGIDSLYNTYRYRGLPPSAIAIPSKMALDAAIHPADVSYLFFVSRLDGTGRSIFSSTLEDHNKAVRRYILKKGMGD